MQQPSQRVEELLRISASSLEPRPRTNEDCTALNRAQHKASDAIQESTAMAPRYKCANCGKTFTGGKSTKRQRNPCQP